MSSASTAPSSVAGLVKTVRGLFFFGSLVKNPDKLDSVFEMRDAMTDPAIVMPIAEALRGAHPRAAAAFRERPRLGKIDIPALAALPAHTLGGAYGRFLQKNGLDPAAIPTLSADADWEYMSAHLYETHDLWHVLTGFGVDVAGEGGLQGFYAAQIPGGLASALLSAILLNNAMLNQNEETQRRMDAITEGWLMGKRAQALFGFRFADRFGDSLADIQRELGIVPVGGAVISRERVAGNLAALPRHADDAPRGSHHRADAAQSRGPPAPLHTAANQAERRNASPPRPGAEREAQVLATAGAAEPPEPQPATPSQPVHRPHPAERAMPHPKPNFPRRDAAVAVFAVFAVFAIAATASIPACAASPAPSSQRPQAEPTAAEASRSADATTLRKCCAALAASADALAPPKAMYAGAAADRCKKDVETVRTEIDQDHLIATLRGELRGTPLPKECD